MTGKWKSYTRQLVGGPAAVFLDVSLRAAAPDADRPVLVLVTLVMKSPRPDGLSSDGEAITLFDVEDALVQALTDAVDGRMTGRITTGGQRQFYFYARAAEGLDTTVHGVLARFPGYQGAVSSRPDPQWQHYLGLLPPERKARTTAGGRAV